MFVHHIVDNDYDINVYIIDKYCVPFIESMDIWLIPGTWVEET